MTRRSDVLWTGPALRDLRSIKEVVSYDKPMAAKRLAARIRQRVAGVVEHPRSGRLVPEFPDSGYREVIVSSYRIIYEVDQDRIVVLRVWHGRRELTFRKLMGP